MINLAVRRADPPRGKDADTDLDTPSEGRQAGRESMPTGLMSRRGLKIHGTESGRGEVIGMPGPRVKAQSATSS